MTGLRERKKDQRTRRIFDAAVALFRRDGFDRTPMEAIAERAEVGVGTLYNYFGSKGGLLNAYLQHEIGQIFGLDGAAHAHVTASGPPAPADDVLSALWVHVQPYIELVQRLGKPLMRECLAASFSSSEAGEGMQRLDLVFVARLTVELQSLQQHQLVRADRPAEEMSMLIYSTMLVQTVIYAHSEADLEGFRAAICSQLELILSGLRPRS